MQIRNTQFELDGQQYLVQVTVQIGQILVVLTDKELMAMDNLRLAVATPYDNLPTVIDILSGYQREDDELLHTLARSLAKKCNLQVFLNYNHETQLTRENLHNIANKIVELIK